MFDQIKYKFKNRSFCHPTLLTNHFFTQVIKSQHGNIASLQQKQEVQTKPARQVYTAILRGSKHLICLMHQSGAVNGDIGQNHNQEHSLFFTNAFQTE